MNKRTTALSIAAVLAASTLAVHAQNYGGGTGTNAQSNNTQQGVPGVEMNVGRNANDGGLPGVEMNVGRDGDQKNIDANKLGAGSDTSMTGGSKSTTKPMRKDRG